MKKLALLIGLLAIVGFAAVPTHLSTDGYYDFRTVDSANLGGVRPFDPALDGADTIAADDSVTIFDRGRLTPGWEYVLVQHASFTGGGADSVDVEVIVDCFETGSSTAAMYRVAIDSISKDGAVANLAGELIEIPLGVTVYGIEQTIKLKGITGAGTVLVIPKFTIIRRRPVITKKNWK